MSPEMFFLLFSFVTLMFLVSCTAFLILCLDDLQMELINKGNLAARVNSVIKVEIYVQAALCAFFLTWHWHMFFMAVPLTYHHLKLYRRGNHRIHVHDVINDIKREKQYRFIKFGIYALPLMIVAFRLGFGNCGCIVGGNLSLFGYELL